MGMWLYMQRIVIPHQVAEAAIHGRPRGNLSDLYPRWLGARELLLRGRDPYSAEVTREIQAGYYGRPLDASRPEDPRDEQRFAYPVYVVFLLAPTVGLPFETVQRAFFWMLLLSTILGVLLWLRVLRWSTPWWTLVSLFLLTVGSPAVMQGLKLRQLSLLVAALVFAAVLLLVSDHLSAAGSMLAMATIKPQLVWLLLLWLAVWTAAEWKRRYRLASSFLVSMMVLVASSEMCLPHWIPRFWQAIQEYQRYTGATSVLDMGLSAALLSLAMTGLICWKERKQVADSEAFARVLCLVLAVTVLVAPTAAPYNQILLLPAMLLLAREWRTIRERRVGSTLLLTLAAAATAWPWIIWTVPFWTVWLNPVAATALMLLVAYRGASVGTAGRVTA